MRGNIKKLKVYSTEEQEAYASLFGVKDIKLEEYYDISEGNSKPEKIKTYQNKIFIFQAASFMLTLVILVSGVFLAGTVREDAQNNNYGYAASVERDSNTPPAVPPIDGGSGESQTSRANQNQNNMRIFKKYDMKFIDQNRDGMPNGCEVVSLTMVLSRYLPDITSREIAEKYMPRKDYPAYHQGVYIAEDPTHYYIGDPAGSGFGIFAPGILRTAQDTLDAYGMNLTAYDISGCGEEELFGYITGGYPVIVWIPMRLAPVSWGRIMSWHLPDWKLYRWPSPMHCAVLVSFTDTKVTLYDPTVGIVDYDRELFLRRWGEMGPYPDNTRHAVVIR